MNILIIGSGGREHALAAAYSKSNKVKKILISPGNAFMQTTPKTKALIDIQITDFEKLLALARNEHIDLVDVAQDDPLAMGYVDKFEKEGFRVFGPTQNAARIEWDKDWARNFMAKYDLPIPKFNSFSDSEKAKKYLDEMPDPSKGGQAIRHDKPLFIKASGLALGKGVIRAESKEEAVLAIEQMQQFGKSGETFLIEEGLVGEEFSAFAICDGKDFVMLGYAQDHKTVFNADLGPNTGGMGCVAPISAVNKEIQNQSENIIKKVITGMLKEGIPYKGILYLGGIIVKEKVMIIEFNARWGDPEAEVILPGITTDYLTLVQKAIDGKLIKNSVGLDSKIRISITGCSQGYPTDYSLAKGKRIFNLKEAGKLPGITIYGAGLEEKNKQYFVSGGRIFHLVAQGETLMQAKVRAYAAMAMIYIEGNNLHYRTDIGWRETER